MILLQGHRTHSHQRFHRLFHPKLHRRHGAPTHRGHHPVAFVWSTRRITKQITRRQLSPVASAPSGWNTSEPAHTATSPASGPLWMKPGSFFPATNAASVPPTIAMSEFTAPSPLIPSTACALITLKPNHPTVRIQAPSARNGIELGAKDVILPSRTRPDLDPSKRTATRRANHPRHELQRIRQSHGNLFRCRSSIHCWKPKLPFQIMPSNSG